MSRRVLFGIVLLWGVLVPNGKSTEPFSLQLVGGGGRCQGQLQVQRAGQGWNGVSPLFIPLWFGNRLCAEMDCGSVLSVEKRRVPHRPVVVLDPDRCETSLISCFTSDLYHSDDSLELSCSDSVRLEGRSLCSGSLQFRDQSSDQSWTGVCDGALDHRGAEVVCRELGCGPPVLQGALSPLGQMFHCDGNESALIDCPQNLTDIHRGNCSTLQLTCEEPVRLVGGSSRCEGVVKMKNRGEWRRVVSTNAWTLVDAAGVCRDLDCGSAVSTKYTESFTRSNLWVVRGYCVKAATVRDCVYEGFSGSEGGLEVVCSEAARLQGRSLCSGSLQIRDQSSDQSWTGVCEGALDHRGAEVVCRELGCGPPLLQGALSPLGQMFHCDGNESTLLDCPRTTARPETHPETCPAQTLTCSELRLVGGSSRCEGRVEVNHGGEWRPMSVNRLSGSWTLESAAAVCRDLDCGFAVFTEERRLNSSDAWLVRTFCVKDTAVRDCTIGYDYGHDDCGLEVLCSELLHVPEVSVSGGVWAPRADEGDWTPLTGGGVWVQMGEDFRVTCSVEPQYEGGSFQLFSPTDKLTAIAVNHSASFLFTNAGPAHRGSYTCVYLLELFNHSFSSNASVLVYPRGVSDGSNMLFLVLIPVFLVIVISATVLTIYCKRRRPTDAGADPNAEGQYENIPLKRRPERPYQSLRLHQMDPVYEVLTRPAGGATGEGQP